MDLSLAFSPHEEDLSMVSETTFLIACTIEFLKKATSLKYYIGQLSFFEFVYVCYEKANDTGLQPQGCTEFLLTFPRFLRYYEHLV